MTVIDPTSNSEIEAKRPTFLTILCVLTMVSSGWGFLSALIGYFTAGSLDDNMEQMEGLFQQIYDSGGASPMIRDLVATYMDVMYIVAENYVAMNTANLLICALSFFGALMMWKLRKQGFYLYLAGQIGGVLVPLIFMGLNIVGLLAAGFATFFSVLFLILYALNLKHLK